MMNRRDLLVGAAGVLPIVSHAQTSSLRERVLGAWRIIDAETVNVATGATQPWLGRPRPYTGIIVYLPNGFMSVQIGAARPPSRVGADFGVLSMEEKAGYADTWYAYFGRFEIDEDRSQVRHIVEGSLFAFETGRTLVRTVQFDNGVLTLRTVNLAKGPDGDTFNRLTWMRI
jgi:Lipocalin-like domain